MKLLIRVKQNLIIYYLGFIARPTRIHLLMDVGIKIGGSFGRKRTGCVSYPDFN